MKQKNKGSEWVHRLMNLKELLPGQDSVIYEFAEMIASYIACTGGPKPGRTVEAFIQVADLVTRDLETGIHSVFRTRLNSNLVGLSPWLYAYSLPDIAQAVLPSDEAENVRQYWNW